MSGLLALLDDVAGIAKVAAASIDDVVGQATKAGAKAAGAVIDDAAVTPKYVAGFKPDRELPIVWKIARGSILNKMLILLPGALILSVFAPWAIWPLLILGGLYLCFEGAEKILHWLRPHAPHVAGHEDKDPGHLEEERVKGAIKTDFILSAEIMTIALAAIDPTAGIAFKAATLAVVAVGITTLVYGAVALIVKADDIGLSLSRRDNALFAAIGRGIVRGMPTFMRLLLIVGTAAMLWVGGNIVTHALKEMSFKAPYEIIHQIAESAGTSGFVQWAVTAGLDGILGLILGFCLIPPVGWVMGALGKSAH